MDLKKIAAQVVFPRLDVDKYEENDSYRNSIENLAKIGVGGFCVFGGNTKSVEITLNKIQTYAETPLLFCADFEYGLPMRLSDGNEFPHSMNIARSGDRNNAFKVGKAIAKEAKSIGIHWNLAPVVDVNSNPLNPIINIRSYGEDAKIVNLFSGEFIRGSQSEKVATCAKHFPGHGDTDVDSHLDLPYLEKTIEELEANEIMPFKNATVFGVRSIMIGHLAVKALETDNIPASLSKNVVKFIREKLKFKGLILTDALDMKSITKKYDSDEAAIKAIEAGNNIALMPENPEIAINALIQKAEKDESFAESLKQSQKKIVNEKRWVGIIPQFATLEGKTQTFMEHQKLALNVAYQGIKIDGNEALIPLNDKNNFAGFAYLQKEEDMRAASRFFTMLAQATENDCDFAFIDKNISDENIESYLEGVENAEIIIFPVFVRSRAFHGAMDTGEKINEIINKIALDRKKIVILMGNPYIENQIDADLIIKSFSDSFPAIAAIVVKLSGREAALNV